MPEVTLVDAINLALARALADDPNVVVFGEDVGVKGGVFRATAGLQRRFGVARFRHAAIGSSDQRALRRYGGAGAQAGRRDPVHGIPLSLH
jgi:pyruvate/2-oxoglutarate/acetoin dehydrogenase E1 component